MYKRRHICNTSNTVYLCALHFRYFVACVSCIKYEKPRLACKLMQLNDLINATPNFLLHQSIEHESMNDVI